MARGRNTPQATPTATPTQTDTINTQGRGNNMSSIDTDKIQALLAGGRQRGVAGKVIKDFLDSGEAGIEVPLDEGAFKGKTAKQTKMALDNAKKSSNANGLVFAAGPDLRTFVEKDGDTERVYLVNPNVS